jgi:hypothetical protein
VLGLATAACDQGDGHGGQSTIAAAVTVGQGEALVTGG